MRKSNKNRKSVDQLSADQGWQHMNILLDKELPVKRESSSIMNWGIAALCLISLSSFLYWSSLHSNLPSEPKTKTKTKTKMSVPVEPAKEYPADQEIALRSALPAIEDSPKEDSPKVEDALNRKSETNDEITASNILTNNNSLKPLEVKQTSTNNDLRNININSISGINKKSNLLSTVEPFSPEIVEVNPLPHKSQHTPIVKSIQQTTIQKTAIAASLQPIQTTSPLVDKNVKSKQNIVTGPQINSMYDLKPEVNQNKLGKNVNLNLSDQTIINPEMDNDQFSLSQSRQKSIELLPTKSEKSILALSSNQNKFDLPKIKLKTKRVNLGLFLASTFGIKGTIGGRAGISVSTKVTDNLSINVDPTFNRVYKLGVDSSFIRGADELILPIYAMYRANKAFGVSLGVFAGLHDKLLKNPNNSFNADSSGSLTTVELDMLEAAYKGEGGKKSGPTYGTRIGLHWFVNQKFRINIGYENSLNSFNQEPGLFKNSQFVLGAGYLFY